MNSQDSFDSDKTNCSFESDETNEQILQNIRTKVENHIAAEDIVDKYELQNYIEVLKELKFLDPISIKLTKKLLIILSKLIKNMDDFITQTLSQKLSSFDSSATLCTFNDDQVFLKVKPSVTTQENMESLLKLISNDEFHTQKNQDAANEQSEDLFDCGNKLNIDENSNDCILYPPPYIIESQNNDDIIFSQVCSNELFSVPKKSETQNMNQSIDDTKTLCSDDLTMSADDLNIIDFIEKKYSKQAKKYVGIRGSDLLPESIQNSENKNDLNYSFDNFKKLSNYLEHNLNAIDSKLNNKFVDNSLNSNKLASFTDKEKNLNFTQTNKYQTINNFADNDMVLKSISDSYEELNSNSYGNLSTNKELNKFAHIKMVLDINSNAKNDSYEHTNSNLNISAGLQQMSIDDSTISESTQTNMTTQNSQNTAFSMSVDSSSSRGSSSMVNNASRDESVILMSINDSFSIARSLPKLTLADSSTKKNTLKKKIIGNDFGPLIKKMRLSYKETKTIMSNDNPGVDNDMISETPTINTFESRPDLFVLDENNDPWEIEKKISEIIGKKDKILQIILTQADELFNKTKVLKERKTIIVEEKEVNIFRRNCYRITKRVIEKDNGRDDHIINVFGNNKLKYTMNFMNK
ncbi:unnamed protein product [Brassicogethes aeneus]|uniref:Uncharacterized protein n=1 Tax=Brassicogethes aeneus TaxID=1431903 RepID=A0A9P0B3W6_BRAAE|nr:unnamed protein product [Brassicogethes aeneus]